MTCQWHVRAALTDERSARRPSPCAPARRTSFVRDWFFFASFSGMSWKQTLEKYTHTVYTYLYGAYDAKDYI